MSSTSRSRTRAARASRSGASRIRSHGGLGLNLVDALSLHWGVADDGDTARVGRPAAQRSPAARACCERGAAGAHEDRLGALERADVRLLDRARGDALGPAARHHQPRVRAGHARHPVEQVARAACPPTRAPRARRCAGEGSAPMLTSPTR